MDTQKMFAVVQRQLSALSRVETKPRYNKGSNGTHTATFTPQDYTRYKDHFLIIEVNAPPHYQCAIEGEKFMSAWGRIEVNLSKLGWSKLP